MTFVTRFWTENVNTTAILLLEITVCSDMLPGQAVAEYRLYERWIASDFV